jgi:hypothetical protein
MTAVLIALVVLLVLALAAVFGADLSYRRRLAAKPIARGARRILFPFVANGLSARALDAALRLANAEQATLVPIFLARVPLNLPLDTPLPRQCAVAVSLQDAIEQRANAFGVPVDARIERGRTYRHALSQTIANERFDRIVIAAAAHGGPGFDADDAAWLLDHASGEIVVLRASNSEQIGPSARRAGRRRAKGARVRPLGSRRERALGRPREHAGTPG